MNKRRGTGNSFSERIAAVRSYCEFLVEMYVRRYCAINVEVLALGLLLVLMGCANPGDEFKLRLSASMNMKSNKSYISEYNLRLKNAWTKLLERQPVSQKTSQKNELGKVIIDGRPEAIQAGNGHTWPSEAKELNAPTKGLRIGDSFVPFGDLTTEFPSIGLIRKNSQDHCTGTAIDQWHILTAAHCFDDVHTYDSFFFITYPQSGVQHVTDSLDYVKLVRFVTHPLYRSDRLGNDLAIALTVEPMKCNPLPVALDRIDALIRIGAPAEFIGYGFTRIQEGIPTAGGIKAKIVVPLSNVNDDEMMISFPGLTTCYGDSGGPAIMDVNARPTIIGVISWADTFCRQSGASMRTDVNGDFIKRALASLPGGGS